MRLNLFNLPRDLEDRWEEEMEEMEWRQVDNCKDFLSPIGYLQSRI